MYRWIYTDKYGAKLSEVKTVMNYNIVRTVSEKLKCVNCFCIRMSASVIFRVKSVLLGVRGGGVLNLLCGIGLYKTIFTTLYRATAIANGLLASDVDFSLLLLAPSESL